MTYLEQIERRQTNLKVGVGLALKHSLAFPVYLVGWLLGKGWWLLSFWIDSFVVGFEHGKGS